MFGNSWRIARIAGVDIKVDASWSIIALLIGVSLYFRFEALHEDTSTGALVALAVVSAIAFFSSVLLHELAHAVVSKARHIPVKGITLFLFGGATEAKLETKEAKDEFLISIVGPLTSAAIAAVLWGVTLGLGDPAESPIADAVGYLAWINLALAVFNLLPGFPLDGGRVLRSAIWAATGSLSKATRFAARAGQLVGYGLIALGILALFAGGFGGLWIALVGWFLAQAAQSSYLRQQLDRMLAGVDAGDVMTTNLVRVPAHVTVQEAIEGWFLRHDHSAYPVEEDDRITGLLTLRGVRRIPREERNAVLVRDGMVPLAEAATVPVGCSLSDVIERFQEDDLQRVLVCDGGRVVGMVTPRDVARWLQRTKELELDRQESIDLREQLGERMGDRERTGR